MTRALPEELSCIELVEIVSDYLEGELPVERRTKLEHHLGYCDGCATFVRQIRAAKRVSGSLVAGAPEVTPETRDRLVAAFRAWKGGRSG